MQGAYIQQGSSIYTDNWLGHALVATGPINCCSNYYGSVFQAVGTRPLCPTWPWLQNDMVAYGISVLAFNLSGAPLYASIESCQENKKKELTLKTTSSTRTLPCLMCQWQKDTALSALWKALLGNYNQPWFKQKESMARDCIQGPRIYSVNCDW